MIRWLTSHVVLKSIILFCAALLTLIGMAFASPIDDVRATVTAWADAWRNQNIIQYMSFYSPAFRSKEFDYQSWLNKKAEHFQKSAIVKLEISHLWVFIEGKHATARFVQHYQDVSTKDIGEKTLRLVNENNRWMIISENWMPLKPLAQSAEKPTTVTKNQDLNHRSQATDITNQYQEKNGLQPNEIIVRNIHFHKEKDFEKLCLDVNRFIIPVIFTLEDKNPRMVIDIKNVHGWKGASTTPVEGRLVKQIRTHLHRKIHKLRIVLDLNPAEDYMIDQSYDSAEYMYCVEIK